MKTFLTIVFAILFLFPSNYSYSQIPTEGLVAYYPFDGDATDASGSGNHGTMIGTVNSPDRFGNSSGALGFNGFSDWVSLPNNSSFDFGSNNFSICYWSKRDNESSPGAVLARDGQIYTPFLMGYSEPGKEKLYMSSDGANWDIANSVDMGVISPAIWKFFVVERDGDLIKTYENGILQSTIISNLALPVASGGPQIGHAQYSFWFQGSIDDIRIYNRALSESEINELYHENGWNPGSISGLKWRDINGDGIKQTDEPGVANWTINISGPINTSTTTNSNGEYTFYYLPVGTYTITETQQTEWTQTYPPALGSYEVEITAGANITFLRMQNTGTTPKLIAKRMVDI